MKKVIVIVGPTASGKTKLSVALAKHFNSEIINGDSVQVYQRLDIGSAKIKPSETEGIKHHLFDIFDPKDQYTVYQFQQDARAKINSIDLPMIVGGTGLYIKAALYNYEFDDHQKTDQTNDPYENIETHTLYEKLITLDPAINIDEKNRRRVIRALALAESGHLRSTKTHKDQPLYDACIIYLDLDKEILTNRLHQRLDIQLEQGFIEEVQSLRKDGIQINAIGYKEINLYLDHEIDYDTMTSDIIKKSKKLAKKQKTWFKNQMDAHILDATDPNLEDQAKAIIKDFLNR